MSCTECLKHLNLPTLKYRRLHEDMIEMYKITNEKYDKNVLLNIPRIGVVRICCEERQSWKLGHGALTVDFRANCSS